MMNGISRKLGLGPLFLLMLVLLTACDVVGVGTTPRATATPTVLSNDFLNYLVPLYSLTLNPGDWVPGTQILYDGRGGDNYQLTIDGQQSSKRTADSLFWRGILAAGVSAEYTLRISPTFNSDSMLAAGPVKLVVLNAVPVVVDVTADMQTAPIHFSLIPIDYTLSVGESMVGTTIIYQGQTEQGAWLGGISGYPYRAAGDSVIWTGRLRGNVAASFNLRTVSYSADSLRLLGTAELWITPEQ
jgi:hypothetical protein